MKYILSLFILASFCFEGIAQNTRNAFEVQVYLKYDSYPTFDDWFEGNSATELTITGMSWGLTAFYRKKLFYNIESKVGIGYYKYRFNNIKNHQSQSEESDLSNRPFDYPNQEKVFLDYYTDKYHYNTFSFHIGADRVFPFAKTYAFLVGVNAVNYFSYSQSYDVIPDRYGIYKLKDFQHFGLSASVNAGINKNIGEFYVGGQVILPVYERWKQDALFREDQGDIRSKWLGGIGGALVSGFRF